MDEHSKVEISEELFNIMVDTLTQLPYAAIQPIFAQLAEELEASQSLIVEK